MSEDNQSTQSISFNPYISPKISDMLVNKFNSDPPPVANEESQSQDVFIITLLAVSYIE